MIIDVVDVVDQNLMTGEVADIQAGGGDPIVMYGMCNAVGDMVQRVVTRASRPGSINLLRLHGHGAPGAQNVGAGEEDMDVHWAGISTTNFSALEPTLARLTNFFASDGRAFLLGCNVGQGTAGSRLLQDLARVWRVPVTAGIQTQYGGTGASTFRFEGPVITAHPGGGLVCGY
jgi:hypothetical protein